MSAPIQPLCTRGVIGGHHLALANTYTDGEPVGATPSFRGVGPSVWIEMSMQNGVVLDGVHPHAVWRDKDDDYGGLTS
ncbi:DUF3500 domain-containing protein [Streptomonospora salina]|uniref:Uncharacterized protein n=1 Tax=Streptomonospora salina TaxID=104205 RepID=A0A841EG92_9ACTN|nr:DUF3500 domain-containing protein [Streptomonospora salina]MBB5999878.1 hypothetical protein [Streptomonospora salina]